MSNKKLKIGITGGIGSGTTTVCKIFESLNIPIYYSDQRAKDLMYRNKDLKLELKKILGQEAYHKNGRPNRPYIAQKIFSDKELLRKVNGLIHPAVRNDYTHWHEQQIAPYTLNEAALLVENNSYKQMDKLIVVTAPKEIRIKRVMTRDNITKDQVAARMKNQLPQKKKEKVADFIIDNEGSRSLIKQVWNIHNTLTSAADYSK